MLTSDRRAQRALAKGQREMLVALGGASISMVAIDEITCDTAVVASQQRIHVFRKGGKSRQGILDPAAISSAYAEGRRIVLGGTGVSVEFRDQSSADKFKTAINQMITASRPRTIPILYPNYFMDLL